MLSDVPRLLPVQTTKAPFPTFQGQYQREGKMASLLKLSSLNIKSLSYTASETPRFEYTDL